MEVIGIYIGPFNTYWDEVTVANGMSGSETWAIELGKQFALKGYEVIMYANPEVEHDVIPNFHLKKHEEYDKDIKQRKYDYFIYSRYTHTINPYLMCNNVYHMSHDVCMITPNNVEGYIGIGKLKAYCYLSEWHKDNLKSMYGKYGLADGNMYKVSNGFSKELYNDIDLDKKENCMIWSSSLTRGFDIFYKYVFLPILLQFPDFKLYVAYTTFTDIDRVLMQNAALLPGVEVLGTISKKELSEYQKRSKIWVCPGIFPETFCITAVENGAAGNVIISPLSYGIKTTLEGIQYLQATNLDILTKENAKNYVNSITNVLINDELRKQCANQCLTWCNNYSWERTADEFINLFNQTNYDKH